MSELQKYRCCPGTEDTYLAVEVDARLALITAENADLLRRLLELDKASGERLALMQRAVDFLCKRHSMRHRQYCACVYCEIPADVAPIICPGSGKGEGA